jgi:hypothetical protein
LWMMKDDLDSLVHLAGHITPASCLGRTKAALDSRADILATHRQSWTYLLSGVS